MNKLDKILQEIDNQCTAMNRCLNTMNKELREVVHKMEDAVEYQIISGTDQ